MRLFPVFQGRLIARLSMLLWTIIVGFSFVAVTAIQPGLSPLLMTAIRFLLAAMALLPWLFRLSNPWPPTKKAWQAYGVLALCLAGFFGAMFAAGHLTTASNLSFLYLSVPLLTLFLGVLYGVEKWSWSLLGLLVMGSVGTFMVISSGKSIEEMQAFEWGAGEQVFLAGCVLMGLYPVLSKRYLLKHQIPTIPLLTTFWSLLIGGVLMGVMGTILEPHQWVVLATQASVADWLWMVYLGIFSTALTFFLLQKATVYLMPTQITAYNFLVPLVLILPSVIPSLNDIPFSFLFGLILVALAVGYLNRSTA